MHANIKNTAARMTGVIFSLGLMFGNLCFAMDSRPLPANGILGTLRLSAMPAIVIDDQLYKLSASAQIRDQKNLLVQTAALSGPDVKVLYKKSSQGQIDRIWILTAQEFQRISGAAK